MMLANKQGNNKGLTSNEVDLEQVFVQFKRTTWDVSLS